MDDFLKSIPLARKRIITNFQPAMDERILRKILLATGGSNNRFADVMSYDEVLRYIGSPEAMNSVIIFNTQPRTKPGEHWMVLVMSPTRAYIMDSLGVFPALVCSDLIPRAFATNGRLVEIGWNTENLQSTDTNVCGEYSLGFARYIMEGRTCASAFNSLLALGVTQHTRDHAVRTKFATYVIRGKRQRMGYGKNNIHVASTLSPCP